MQHTESQWRPENTLFQKIVIQVFKQQDWLRSDKYINKNDKLIVQTDQVRGFD